MSRNVYLCTAVAALLGNPLNALAANDTDLQSVTEQIRQLKQSNAELEQRLRQVENFDAQVPFRSNAAPSSANSFNPAVALILSGTYEQFRQDPAIPATGFAMNPNDTGYTHGLSLQESELSLSADIDPQYSGLATF